jgi:hypothetical protein
MGRRARRARASAQGPAVARDHMARVGVDEESWREFRHAIGPLTVSRRLGELVLHDVAERRRRRLHAGQLDAREVQEALEQAGALARDLETITQRLEALARPRSCG